MIKIDGVAKKVKLSDKLAQLENKIETIEKNNEIKDKVYDIGMWLPFNWGMKQNLTVGESIYDIREDVKDIEKDISLIMEYLGIEKKTTQEVTKMEKKLEKKKPWYISNIKVK